MKYERINDLNRNLVNAFIQKQWYTTTMVIRGKVIDMTKTEGFYFGENSIPLRHEIEFELSI